MLAPTIREGVKERLDEGRRLSELAVLVGERGGQVVSVAVLRKAVTYKDAERPVFMREVAAAMARGGVKIPVVVRLPIRDGRLVVVGDVPDEIRSLVWFDYEASVRGAN
jgi:hypothetical protein